MSYRVLVDDNYHAMDESERYTLGEYPSLDQAIEAAKAIVDAHLLSAHHVGMTALELLSGYKAYGEDPFIVSGDASGAKPPFSAWEYAEQRSIQICGDGGRMEVILHLDRLCFLLRRGDDYYLDINCANSFVGYSLFLQLTDDECVEYRASGESFIRTVAEKINGHPEEFFGRDVRGSLQDEAAEAIGRWLSKYPDFT
jgi:hypothetical protein